MRPVGRGARRPHLSGPVARCGTPTLRAVGALLVRRPHDAQARAPFGQGRRRRVLRCGARGCRGVRRRTRASRGVKRMGDVRPGSATEARRLDHDAQGLDLLRGTRPLRASRAQSDVAVRGSATRSLAAVASMGSVGGRHPARRWLPFQCGTSRSATSRDIASTRRTANAARGVRCDAAPFPRLAARHRPHRAGRGEMR